MFHFFSHLFSNDLNSREFVVFAQRRTLPPARWQVFSTFKVRANSVYEAARTFDQTYTAWSRLAVEEG